MKIFPNRSTALRAGLLASTAFMSPAERLMGRFMRAPDVHDGGDAGAGDASEGDAGGDQGAGGDGDAGAGDAGAGDAGDQGAGDGDDAGDGTALGDGGDAGDAGDDGDGDGSDGEGDGDAAAEGAPDTYDLTTEGVELDADTLAEADPVLRELGLSNDQAKTLVPLAAKMMDRAVDATVSDIVARGNAQRKAWLDEAKAAEDIGGAKWDDTMHVAARGLDALGFVKGDKDKKIEPHPFRLALETSGFGNHPDMIRLCAKLGELVSEDGDFVRADASAPANGDVKKQLYPNESKGE